MKLEGNGWTVKQNETKIRKRCYSCLIRQHWIQLGLHAKWILKAERMLPKSMEACKWLQTVLGGGNWSKDSLENLCLSLFDSISLYIMVRVGLEESNRQNAVPGKFWHQSELPHKYTHTLASADVCPTSLLSNSWIHVAFSLYSEDPAESNTIRAESTPQESLMKY